MQDNIIDILVRPLKSQRDADIIGRARRPCIRILHKPKPRRGDNQLDVNSGFKWKNSKI